MKDKYDTPFYYYYGQLNSEEKEIYCKIAESVESASEGIKFERPQKQEVIERIEKAVYYDQPNLFWWIGYAESYSANSEGLITGLKLKYNGLLLNLDKNKEKFNEITDLLTSQVKGDSDIVKEFRINGWMAKNVEYVHNDLDQTSFASIVNGQAVCAGYSRGFQHIMMSLGIPCYYITGDTYDKEKDEWSNDSHAWNIICLDDEFYNIDITWNDHMEKRKSEEYISYEYFNVSDEEIGRNHRKTVAIFTIPECVSTKLSFESVTGINSKAMDIIQGGVDYKDLIKTENEVRSLFSVYLNRQSDGIKNMQIAFPVYGESIKDRLSSIFEECIKKSKFSGKGYSISCSHWDYGEAFYKAQISVEIKS